MSSSKTTVGLFRVRVDDDDDVVDDVDGVDVDILFRDGFVVVVVTGTGTYSIVCCS